MPSLSDTQAEIVARDLIVTRPHVAAGLIGMGSVLPEGVARTALDPATVIKYLPVLIEIVKEIYAVLVKNGILTASE